MYISEEFATLAQHIRDTADCLGEAAGPAALKAMGQAYITGVRLESQFWDTVYSLERWKG